MSSVFTTFVGEINEEQNEKNILNYFPSTEII
jgi:hypothetical protein